jgi:hypothetical protein
MISGDLPSFARGVVGSQLLDGERKRSGFGDRRVHHLEVEAGFLEQLLPAR